MKNVNKELNKAIVSEEIKKIFEIKKELLQLVIAKSFGQLKDSSKMKKMRKEIVRMKSI